MDYRILNLVLVSANGLKKSRFTKYRDIYAVAYISSPAGNSQKLRTSIAKNVDSDPTWNFPMKFAIDEQNRLRLVVKIKAVGLFGGKNLGEVHVPIKELLDGVKAEGKAMQNVNYQLKGRSGKQRGVLCFTYEIGEKVPRTTLDPVMAYPVASSSGNPTSSYVRGQTGYAYPAQQPGYGHYPPPVQGYSGYPPQPVVQQPIRRSGMGFGTGLMGGALGGLMLGEMMSGGGGCGGGGCGGGGCGGGCGGGGCGG